MSAYKPTDPAAVPPATEWSPAIIESINAAAETGKPMPQNDAQWCEARDRETRSYMRTNQAGARRQLVVDAVKRRDRFRAARIANRLLLSCGRIGGLVIVFLFSTVVAYAFCRWFGFRP